MRSGFVKSFFSLINIIFSLFASIYISLKLSGTIYDYFIKENLINQVHTAIDNGSINSNSVIDKIPDFISNSFSYYGITSDKLTDIINSGKTDVANRIVDAISPAFIQIIHAALSSVLFFVFIIVLGIVLRWILKIFRLPILSQVDHALGSVLGLMKGYLIISLLIFFLRSWIQTLDYSPDIFSYPTIESTFIFKHMYTNNLIYNIIKEI